MPMRKLSMGWILIALLLVFISTPWLAAGPRLTMFSYRGTRSADGTLLLQPMLAPQIGIDVFVGTEPKKGDVLNCQVSTKTLGQISTDDGKIQAHRIYLLCGKNVYVLKGILFAGQEP